MHVVEKALPAPPPKENKLLVVLGLASAPRSVLVSKVNRSHGVHGPGGWRGASLGAAIGAGDVIAVLLELDLCEQSTLSEQEVLSALNDIQIVKHVPAS